jgi:hypothetical protein
MNASSRPNTPRRRFGRAGQILQTRQGFALIVVLMLLAMTTILAVAFAFTMRTERVVSANMVSGQKADLIAHNALNHAISLLAHNIPDPADPAADTPEGQAKGWFTNPGRLVVFGPLDRSEIPLHTGASSDKPEEGFNLNAASPVTRKYPITGDDDPMWLAWKNVLEDNTSPASADNQLVGRYAFWIDDESTKINFNTARGKPNLLMNQVQLPGTWKEDPNRNLIAHLTPTFDFNDGNSTTTYALGQPQSVNLDLNQLGIDVGPLHRKFTERKQFFNNMEDIKYFAKSSPDETFEKAKFYVTPYSRAPEFNVFGKSRLFVLNKIGDLATSPTHQHYTHPTEPMVFWGGYSGVGNNTSADAKHMGYLRRPVVEALAKYFDRGDWPGFGSKRFRWTLDKNDPVGRLESDQIALNMANMGYWGGTSVGSTTDYNNFIYRWAMHGGYSPAPTPNQSLIKGPLTGKPTLSPYFGPQLSEIACTLTPESGTGGTTRLKFQFQYEIYMPGGFYVRGTDVKRFGNGHDREPNPTSNNYIMDMSPSFCSVAIEGLTVNKTQKFVYAAANGLSQRNRMTTLHDPEGQREFYIDAGEYQVMTPSALYVGTTEVFRRPAESANSRFQYTGAAKVTVRLRYGIFNRNKQNFVQAAPAPAAQDEGADAGMTGPGDEGYLEFVFQNVSVGTGTQVRSLEIEDPRLAGLASAWKPLALNDDSLMEENKNPDFKKGIEKAELESKMANWNFDLGANITTNGLTGRATSPGMFTFISTGLQRGIPWDTFQFHYNDTRTSNELPDWVVLDLLAPVFPSPISRAHSTAGRINLNSRIYPKRSSTFSPPEREYPTEALFKNLPNGDAAAKAVLDWQEDPLKDFDYVGRLCDIPQVADNNVVIDSDSNMDFDRESLIRNLAGLVTTQSNVFGVWGVAQSVKIKRRTQDFDKFKTGDAITGQRRFYAVVERYVWQGREGVPGNAYVDNTGAYLKTAQSTTPGAAAKEKWPDSGKWAVIDGPQAPITNDAMGDMPYEPTKLEVANNPIAPVIKYRVVHMQYVD